MTLPTVRDLWGLVWSSPAAHAHRAGRRRPMMRCSTACVFVPRSELGQSVLHVPCYPPVGSRSRQADSWVYGNWIKRARP
jgi:hypothetical protein